MNLARALLFSILAMCLFQHPARAAERTMATERKEPEERYAKRLKQAEEYLSRFATLETRFSQIAPGEGNISEGTLHISRPGRARWEYISPRRTLTIVNNKQLSYYDYDLDQVSYAEIPESPLEMLLYKNISFSNGYLTVLRAMEEQNTFSVEIAAAKDLPPKPGMVPESLTLVFSKSPFELRRLYRTDTSNSTTALILYDVVFDNKLDDNLFIFKNPRLFKKR